MMYKLFLFIFFFLFGVFANVFAVNTKDVIINEIAWMGTDASSYGEWIELYNMTVNDVSLDGWKLYEQGGDVLIIELAGIVPSSGYYLIERITSSSPDPVVNISANISGKFGGAGLSNNGEYLVLKDIEDNVIDEINFAPSEACIKKCWPVGNAKPGYFSMERASDGTWQNNDGITKNGKDADGNDVNGTPKFANSVPVSVEVIQEVIEQDEAQSPQIVSIPPQQEIPPKSSGYDVPIVPIVAGDIIINEIAWAGTKAKSTAEWIELKNITGRVIDLARWGVYESGGDVLIITLTKTIAPYGYYLIERTNDDSISDIVADDFGSFGGSGLRNDGEYIALKDSAGNIIDEIRAGDGWFAGTAKPDYFSMERAGDGIWQNNNGITRNGKDVNGNDVNGTPRQKNSEHTAILPAVTEEDSLESSEIVVDNIATTTVVILDVQKKQSYDGLYINEFLPNPQGDDRADEWIELYNESDVVIDLFGFVLEDVGGKRFIISRGAVLEPKSYIVFLSQETKITLNNNGDALSLFFIDSEEQTLISRVVYEKSHKEKSIARNKNGEYVEVSIATPGFVNKIDVVVSKLISKKTFSPTDVSYENKKILTVSFPTAYDESDASENHDIVQTQNKYTAYTGASFMRNKMMKIITMLIILLSCIMLFLKYGLSQEHKNKKT